MIRPHFDAGRVRAFGLADLTPNATVTSVSRRIAASVALRNPRLFHRLEAAILAQPKGSVPCIDPNDEVRRLWTSDDPEEAKRAAKACSRCPVRVLCRAVGRTEHAGVWGGISRATTRTSTDEGEAA